MADVATAPSPAPSGIAGMGQDIARDEQMFARRTGDLAGKSAEIAAGRESTLAPMEAQISQSLAEPLPQRAKVDIPQFKPEPVIDAKDYEKLSYGLIAMAMIGGIASKGKWLEVGDSLNGALSGYLKGNQEVAAKRYKDYEEGFKGAMAKEAQANKEFTDILSDKRMRISDQIAQYRIVAAKYDRQDALVAAQSRSLDAMWRSIESRKTAMARLEESHDRATEAMSLRRDMFNDRRDAATRPAEPSLSPDAIKQAALRYNTDGTFPPNIGRGKQGSANINAILDAAAPEGGDNPRVRQLENKSNALSLSNITKQMDSVKSFEATALKNLDMLVAQSEKVSRLGVPILDKQIMAGTKAVTGDPELVKFYAIVKPFTDEYAKILEGKTGAGGSTVSGREQAAELLQPYFTKEGIRQLAPFMKQEMENRTTSLEEQRTVIKDRMKGRGDASSSAPPKQKITAPLTNSQGWALHTDAQGNQAYVGPNNEVEEVSADPVLKVTPRK